VKLRLTQRVASWVKANLALLKILWFAIVIGVAVYYAYGRAAVLYEIMSKMDVVSLLLCALFIIVAKLQIGGMIVIALRRSAQAVRFRDAFRMYNSTQVAKYLPGGIWHFIGRAYLYRALGMSVGRINKAIVIENFWLVLGAATTAMIFGLAWAKWGHGQEEAWYALTDLPVFSWVESNTALGASVAVVLVLLMVFVLIGAKLRSKALHVVGVARPDVAAASLMIGTQVAIGVALYVVLAPLPAQNADIFRVVSACAAATALGYLAVFAPAGIGVKDAALMALLVPAVSHEVAFLAAAMHRLVYLVVDLLLAVMSGFARADAGPGDTEAQAH
jgi:hypothetical protein